MVNVYALWISTGSPSGNWSVMDSSPDGKYFRQMRTAFSTGGGATHSLSTTGTNSVGDYTSSDYGKNDMEVQAVKSILSTHDHSLSSVTAGAADNAPSYYNFRLIKCEIGAFFASERKLPRYSVMASTTTLSATGLSRHTAADGRLVKISYSTVGGIGGSETHRHALSGTTSDASLNVVYVDSSFTPYDICGAPSGDGTHNHPLTSKYTEYADSKPARIVTRLYEVTTTNTSVIPTNAVLWVDGSITGYTDQLELLTAWNSKFLESGNQDAASSGADTHNHGSAATGTLSTCNRSAVSRANQLGYYETTYVIKTTHTHTFSVGLSTTNIDHKPLYWSLIPVRVKADINATQTKTTAASLDVILKKTRTTSAGFDLLLHKSGAKYTSMDVMLKKYGVTKTHTMDAVILKNRQATAQMDVLLQRKRLLAAYLMSLAPLFAKNINYTMSTRLVYEDIPAIYPVIDVLYSSWAAQFDKIHKKIVTSGLDLSIDTAGSTALDKRWGRAFNLPREPGESDTYYKKRLLAFTASTTGCGTKKALQDILNVASDGDSAQVDVFPGKILVRYTDPLQLKRAKAREDLVETLLASSVAAGVEYLTPYPFVEHTIDMLLKKEGVTLDYSAGLALQVARDSPYDMDLLIRGKQDLGYEMDTLIQMTRTLNYASRCYIQKAIPKTYEADLIMKKAISSPYEMSLRARKILHRNLLMSALIQKTKKKTTSFSTTLKWIGERSYGLSALLLGHPTADFDMDLLIRGSSSLGYGMDTMLASRLTWGYDMDLLIRGLQSQGYDMDLIIEGLATRSAMGADLSGGYKWFGGVLGNDGKIYGIPFNSTDILIIDPSTGTATRSAMGASLSGSYKWRGGVLGNDGKIYGIPYDSADILIIKRVV